VVLVLEQDHLQLLSCDLSLGFTWPFLRFVFCFLFLSCLLPHFLFFYCPPLFWLNSVPLQCSFPLLLSSSFYWFLTWAPHEVTVGGSGAPCFVPLLLNSLSLSIIARIVSIQTYLGIELLTSHQVMLRH